MSTTTTTRTTTFTAAHPDTDWRAAVEHGEAIGLGTTHYELVTV